VQAQIYSRYGNQIVTTIIITTTVAEEAQVHTTYVRNTHLSFHLRLSFEVAPLHKVLQEKNTFLCICLQSLF
jgi:hypothetical protein